MVCCSEPPMAAADRAAWWRIGIGAVIAVNSMTVDLAINTSEADPSTQQLVHLGVLIATGIVFVLLGAPLLAAVWRQARRWQLTLEAMFVLAIVGALGASLIAMFSGEGAVYFEVAAILLVVYSLGQQLGRTAQRRATDATLSWQRELDSCQLIEPGGEVRTIAVAELQPGQVVEVQPGRLIPVDGEVVAGESFVREATLTGEHQAVVRRPGDQVWAGTHATDGLLRVRATAAGTARRIDGILAAVEHARANPGRLQRQADRFISVFLPVVSAVAILTGVGWGIAKGAPAGLFSAMSVLLVACPCALGLATPLAVWRALGTLARHGLIPHDADAIERLAAAHTVVLDKTGTITESTSRLSDFVTSPDAPLPARELLAVLARIEAGNPHPLASAFASGEHVAAAAWTPERVRVLPGVGLEAELVGPRAQRLHLLLGAPSRLCSQPPLASAFEATRQRVHTGVRGQDVVVLVNGALAAVAVVAEHPRPGWEELRAALAALGCDLIVMSGDVHAYRAGLGEVKVMSGLGPEDKLAEVQRLQSAGRAVMFVGDGVNDAAAMAVSSVSVAMQEGAELARDVATLSWHGRHLQDLATGLKASRAAVRTIRSNLYFAASYNLTGVGLAAAGILHPIVAALLMTCSSLIVTWRAAGLGREGEEQPADEGVSALSPLEVTR